MIKLMRFLVGAAFAAATALPAQAAVTYVFDTAVEDSIPGLTGFMTTGNLMEGMSVTATFTGPFTETLPWEVTGPTGGGVSGTGWGLSLDGDTFTAPWLFSIDPDRGQIVSLVLDGIPGLTVFDVAGNEPPDFDNFNAPGDPFGTPGSAQGVNFDFPAGSAIDAIATYSRIVAIPPDASVGDIYHVLTVAFDLATSPRTDFSFFQDTDNDSRRSVPEPGTLALLGLTAGAIAWVHRKRKPA